jgi:hypothetical protein
MELQEVEELRYLRAREDVLAARGGDEQLTVAPPERDAIVTHGIKWPPKTP